MLSRVSSLGLKGIDGYEVSVECYITTGLPGFDVVGLPDAAVKEARERVRAAIKVSGFRFPVSHITLNLAPAGTRKSGTLYDLPILLGILAASGALRLPKIRCAFLGELSLEGKVRPVPGVLPMALAAREAGFEAIFVLKTPGRPPSPKGSRSTASRMSSPWRRTSPAQIPSPPRRPGRRTARRCRCPTLPTSRDRSRPSAHWR